MPHTLLRGCILVESWSHGAQEARGCVQEVDGCPPVSDEGRGQSEALQHPHLVILRPRGHGPEGVLT